MRPALRARPPSAPGCWSAWIAYLALPTIEVLAVLQYLAGVGWLARWIDGLTAWKLAVPLLISITLMLASGHWDNLAASSIPPSQTLQGMVTAISSGGILFSLLGFRTAMDLAGETRRPQRNVPLAGGWAWAGWPGCCCWMRWCPPAPRPWPTWAPQRG